MNIGSTCLFFHGDAPLSERDPGAGLCVSSRTAPALSYMTAQLRDQTLISCSDRVPLSLPKDAAGDTLQHGGRTKREVWL